MLVLLAMGLRALYTPIHLAQEQHFGVGGHSVSHAEEDEGHGSDDHEHDDDHPPHPILDHTTDLIAQRTQDHHGAVDLTALLSEEDWSPLAPMQLPWTTEPEPKPPKPKPRPVPRPRGPPAVA
jgi:hypothetical protein